MSVIKTLADFRECPQNQADNKKEIEIKLITEKKGALLAEKLNAALTAGAGLDQLKAKFPDLIVDSIPATPTGGNMPKFGNEPDVMGMAAALPLNKLSKAVVGKQGVYVLQVNKRAGNEFPVKDFSPEQNDIAQKNKSLVDQFMTEALKTGIDVEDNRFEKLD